MIIKKKKICIECNTPQYIFSKGRCQKCASKTYKPLSKKRKTTGEKVLFLEIWSERKHICNNCKKQLGEEPRPYMFSHVKPKGLYPELRLEKTNIDLSCWDCHYAWGNQGIDKFNARKDLYANIN